MKVQKAYIAVIKAHCIAPRARKMRSEWLEVVRETRDEALRELFNQYQTWRSKWRKCTALVGESYVVERNVYETYNTITRPCFPDIGAENEYERFDVVKLN